MFRLLTNWDKSGLGQKEFCQKNGVNYFAFKYWNKKRKLEGEINNGLKKEQPSASLTENTDKFIPIIISQKLRSSGLCITYPNMVQVTCPEEIELEQFKKLIQIY